MCIHICICIYVSVSSFVCVFVKPTKGAGLKLAACVALWIKERGTPWHHSSELRICILYCCVFVFCIFVYLYFVFLCILCSIVDQRAWDTVASQQ